MANKQVTVAEFRMNLKEYLDQIMLGEIIEVRGIPLCMYIPPLSEEAFEPMPPSKGEPSKLMLLQAKIHEIEGRDSKALFSAMHPSTSEDVHENLHGACDLCTQHVQLYHVFDDGDRKICEICLKQRLGNGAAKYISEGNKVQPQELAKSAPVVLNRQSNATDRPDLNYCSSCKFQVALGGQTLCGKCVKKSKKK